MPAYITVAIVCVSLLAIYISILARLRKGIDRYIRFFLGYLALHAAHAWAVRTYFEENMRLDYYAPYGLAYGPFLYFAYQVAAGNPLKKWRVLLHALPFFAFLGAYFLWIGFPSLFAGHLRVFGLSLYGSLSVSLCTYAIWALFFKSPDDGVHRNMEARMISVMAIILSFIAVVFLVFTYSSIFSGFIRSHFKGSIIYLTMLSAALILFSYIVKQLVGRSHVTMADDINVNDVQAAQKPAIGDLPEATVNERYQKSAVASVLLADYELAVRERMEKQKGYLDEHLSLDSLAQQLKIPRHHLSQVFSACIKKNFNTYVNEHRINHASALIRNHPEMNITEIYLNSGFTAKASFNRYFKQFHGCTPSEYRSKSRDN